MDADTCGVGRNRSAHVFVDPLRMLMHARALRVRARTCRLARAHRMQACLLTHGVHTHMEYVHRSTLTHKHTHTYTHTHTHIDLHMFSDLISVDTLFREAGISPNGQVKISEFVQTIMTPSPDY